MSLLAFSVTTGDAQAVVTALPCSLSHHLLCRKTETCIDYACLRVLHITVWALQEP